MCGSRSWLEIRIQARTKKMSDEDIDRAHKAYHAARKEAVPNKMSYEEEPMETGTSSSPGRAGKNRSGARGQK